MKDKGKIETVEKHIGVIDISTPLENPTFKRLIRWLRDVRKDISHLKEEELDERKKLKDLMDMYLEILIFPGLRQGDLCPSIGSLRIYTIRTKI
jgi:hypothetical protein